MKNVFVILLLAWCIIAHGQNIPREVINIIVANQSVIFNKLDSMHHDVLNINYSDTVIIQIETDSLFIEYEQQLGTYQQSIPCDCWPCAMYCYRIVQIEPDYYDFKRWYKAKLKLNQ